MTPRYTAIILLIGFASGLGQTIRAVREIIMADKSKRRENSEPADYRAILWLSAGILILGLFTTTARISYDATAIYFSDAKLTALAHHIRYFTDGTFVASVFQSAIQFTALIQLFGDQSARMLSWIYGVVVIIFSLALAENVGLSRREQTILLALLLSSTAFIDLLGDGKVDLFSAAFAIATAYWMNVEVQCKLLNRPILLLVGFLAGLACVTRPFNAFLLGIFTLAFYIQQAVAHWGSRREAIWLFFRRLFWTAIGVIVWGIQHLLTNWMILGDPLAFLSSLSAINSSTGPWDAGPNHMLLFRLLYPIIATFRNTPQSLGNVTPLFIGFLPFVFSRTTRSESKISNRLLGLVITSLITLCLWVSTFFTVVEIRYVFFLWIILFLPAAKIIDNTLKSENPFFRHMEHGAILALLTFICLRTIFIALDSYSPLDEQGNPQCYDRALCAYLRPVNQVASPGDRVLTLSAYRYYLRTDLFACSTTHEEYRVLQEASHGDAELFWREIYQQGYNYIVYEKEYTLRHLGLGIIPSPENAPSWITLEPVFETFPDDLIAYRIEVNNPPIEENVACKRGPDGVWSVIPIE